MLVLRFQVQSHIYALDTQFVLELAPWVHVRELVGVEPAVLGLMDYRGAMLPVIDLSFFLAGEHAPRCLSTRIAVCELSVGKRSVCCGLLLENAKQVIEVEEHLLFDAPIQQEWNLHLGPCIRGTDPVVQLIDIQSLFQDERFSRLVEEGGCGERA